MHCNHCNGNIVGDKCLQCGRPVKKEFVYTKRSVEHYKKTGPKPTNKPKQGDEGICRCCGHKKRIWSDWLCSSCLSYVSGRYGQYLPKGPAREAKLKLVAAWKKCNIKKVMNDFNNLPF